jgi:hypothetical protein
MTVSYHAPLLKRQTRPEFCSVGKISHADHKQEDSCNTGHIGDSLEPSWSWADREAQAISLQVGTRVAPYKCCKKKKEQERRKGGREGGSWGRDWGFDLEPFFLATSTFPLLTVLPWSWELVSQRLCHHHQLTLLLCTEAAAPGCV